MSFWNNPGASFQGLMDDPWHSLENFGTTGLVPLIPYVGGIVGGIFGGPGGAAAGGALGQESVDYFGGNSEARSGKGIQKSLFGGAGKGMLASGGYNYGAGGGFDGLSNLFGGGSESSYGMLDSIGGDGGSFSGDLFQLDGGGQGSIGSGDIFSGWSPTGSDAGYSGSQLSPDQIMNLNSNPYTPEYLDKLAYDNGVDAGNPTLWDRLTGNTEQDLYDRENLAQKASGNSIQDLLKKQAQQRALGQITQSGSKLQEQNAAQQTEQNKMAQLQAMMRRGQNVDVVSSLLSLLQEQKQSKQPRISLI
jgi:hypothetical protein